MTSRPEKACPLLLIDAGNTRVKWALWDQQLAPHRSASWDELALEDHLPGTGKVERIVVANVGGRRIHDLIGDAGAEILFVESEREACGVTNSYRDPSQMGADRWAAMIGARHHRSGPLVVVDAGTATTVDLLDADGAHLGGVIVPGYRMMLMSLLGNTSDIADVAEAVPGGTVIEEEYAARSTGEAIHSGALIALVSLIRHSQEYLKRQAKTSPRILLCGGDADMLLPLLHDAATVPDLVLRGLAIIAGNKP